jgi:hypothetical protein
MSLPQAESRHQCKEALADPCPKPYPNLHASQFCNHLEVVILPPYRPSEAERADARLYAANVRAAMAAALGAPLSAQGIAQQQALKRAGVTVDWTGRCGARVRQRRMCTSASSP